MFNQSFISILDCLLMRPIMSS